jgi:hypothetical protein
MPARSFRNLPSRLKLQELRNVALRARDSCAKSCDVSDQIAIGRFSVALPIVFDDGVEWIAKFPRDKAFTKYPNIRRSKLESKVATLQLVKAKTTIPVPTVFTWDSSASNSVGCEYILMSHAKGCILDQYSNYFPTGEGTHMTNEQKSKLYGQLARYIHELSNLRFPKIGSIFYGNGEFIVDECLRITTLEYG